MLSAHCPVKSSVEQLGGKRGMLTAMEGTEAGNFERNGVSAGCLGSAGRVKVPSHSAAVLNKKAVDDGDWCQRGLVVKTPDGFPPKKSPTVCEHSTL